MSDNDTEQEINIQDEPESNPQVDGPAPEPDSPRPSTPEPTPEPVPVPETKAQHKGPQRVQVGGEQRKHGPFDPRLNPSVAIRHKKRYRTHNSIDGIKNGPFMRLLKRAGITRISRETYDYSRKNLRAHLVKVLTKTMLHTECAKRVTILPQDVLHATNYTKKIGFYV